MSTTEAARHHLIERAVEVLGQEAAMTLADHLPPTGWADVATKADVRALEDRIDARMGARFDGVDARFDATEARMDARFDAVDARFDATEARMDARFDAVDARFDAVDARFDTTATHTDVRFEGLEQRIERVKHELIGVIHETVTAQTRLYIFAMISTLVSVAGVALAAAQLSG